MKTVRKFDTRTVELWSFDTFELYAATHPHRKQSVSRDMTKFREQYSDILQGTPTSNKELRDGDRVKVAGKTEF